MNSRFVRIAVVTPLALAIGLAYAAGREPAPRDKPKEHKPITVTAVAATTAPTLDGDAKDAAWKAAPAVKFNAVNGYNFKDGKGKSSGTIQATYDKENLYLLVTYDDPTYSVRRSPYQKQKDGSWAML